MKKRGVKNVLLTSVLLLATLMSACAPGREDAKDVSEEREYRDHDSDRSSGGSRRASDDESDSDSDRQEYAEWIRDEQKPELIEVILSGECDGRIADKVNIADMYGIDILSSGVVGLVGAPVSVTFYDVKDPKLCFVYDPSELRGIPERNLILLHLDEETQFYETIQGSETDTTEHELTAPIEEDGIYLLADAYQWYGCWGADVSAYAYDVNDAKYESDWEREYDTGSIMELADKEWAQNNAPYFYVSTPEELASVVYYVNATDCGEVSITLEDDIDLGGYRWMPMGWHSSLSHPFSGMIDGGGHTIYGLTIDLGFEDCGFVGYGLGVEMHDISFVDANVHGTACTGIAGGEIYGSATWENVYAEGIVEGGSDDYGAIIGREANISFENCSMKVTANGRKFNYESYRQMTIATTPVNEVFLLTLNDDMTITRDEHEGFQSLSWQVEHDGRQVLQRGAEDFYTGEPELTLDTQYQWIDGQEGKHTIYLVAYINGTYIRVSNIIEYTK